MATSNLFLFHVSILYNSEKLLEVNASQIHVKGKTHLIHYLREAMMMDCKMLSANNNNGWANNKVIKFVYNCGHMDASGIICHLSLRTSTYNYIPRRHHLFRHLPKFARKADNNHQNIEETMKQMRTKLFMSKYLLKGISEIVANVLRGYL